jgi:hypothetical protein
MPYLHSIATIAQRVDAAQKKNPENTKQEENIFAE